MAEEYEECEELLLDTTDIKAQLELRQLLHLCTLEDRTTLTYVSKMMKGNHTRGDPYFSVQLYYPTVEGIPRLAYKAIRVEDMQQEARWFCFYNQEFIWTNELSIISLPEDEIEYIPVGVILGYHRVESNVLCHSLLRFLHKDVTMLEIMMPSYEKTTVRVEELLKAVPGLRQLAITADALANCEEWAARMLEWCIEGPHYLESVKIMLTNITSVKIMEDSMDALLVLVENNYIYGNVELELYCYNEKLIDVFYWYLVAVLPHHCFVRDEGSKRFELMLSDTRVITFKFYGSPPQANQNANAAGGNGGANAQGNENQNNEQAPAEEVAVEAPQEGENAEAGDVAEDGNAIAAAENEEVEVEAVPAIAEAEGEAAPEVENGEVEAVPEKEEAEEMPADADAEFMPENAVAMPEYGEPEKAPEHDDAEDDAADR